MIIEVMDKAKSRQASWISGRVTSSEVCLSLPEGGSKLVGSDQNQRGRLINVLYVNWQLFSKVGCSHHREFRGGKVRNWVRYFKATILGNIQRYTPITVDQIAPFQTRNI